MEAFSDGVFSIAATLLVLDIALRPPGTPLEQVLHAWPAYLGHVISFLTIGAAWIGHDAITDRLTRADSLLLRINRRTDRAGTRHGLHGAVPPGLHSVCTVAPDRIFRRGAEWRFPCSVAVWAGVDLNHRRHTPADLQSAPFGHSGTDPWKGNTLAVRQNGPPHGTSG
jgi:hypothetical protein